MERSDFPNDLFVPWTVTKWRKGRQEVLRNKPAGQIVGVRMQADSDPEKDRTRSRETQHDLVRLVGGIRTLRAEPGLEASVLAPSTAQRRQPLGSVGRRARFCVECVTDSGCKHDQEAAKVCHQRIERATRRSGFEIEVPETFDPISGMEGLQRWAEQVEMRRRRRPLWWLLLLLLPLLALLLTRPSCSPTFMDQKIKRSLVVLADRSPSMSQCLPIVKDEVEKTLKQMTRSLIWGSYVDVILYDSQPDDLMGSLVEVDDRSQEVLQTELENALSVPGGGTNLEPALQVAASHIKALGDPTTVVVITDAADASVASMLQQKQKVRSWFGEVKLDMQIQVKAFEHCSEAPKPLDDISLQALADFLSGRKPTQ